MSVGSKVHSLSTECAGIVSCEWEVVELGLVVQGVEPVGALALICLVLFPLPPANLPHLDLAERGGRGQWSWRHYVVL